MSSGLPRLWWFSIPAVVVLAVLSVDAVEFGSYREFHLGDSAAAVAERTGTAVRDVRTLHDEPALLQDLSWRPSYWAAGSAVAERDSVSGIVFSFVDDQLYRMEVEYGRRSTDGLTREDMVASLSAVYGAPVARTASVARRPVYDSLDTPEVVARWTTGETSVTLQQTAYSHVYGLVIVSAPLDARARTALAAARVREAREAPARDAARVRAIATAAAAAAEATRTANKAAFTP